MEIQTENSAQFEQYLEKYKPGIENALREHFPPAPPNIETRFAEAVESALFSGGKRLLPVLTLLGAELFGGKVETFFPVATAVEFVRTSASIFEDLPFMNDASQRSGLISLREKYGEGLATFVAVGLLNASYGLVFVNHNGLPERAMQAHAEIAECVGASGLIGGKLTDSFAETLYLESGKNTKVAVLMRLALRLGAILAGANYLELAQLSRFAELLGDADRNSCEDAKRILVENFPSSEARTCLIQLTDYLGAGRS
jgi:geranylgeranyl diphosphate synthase type II